MKYCKYCGNELKEGADFCLSCGKLIEKETTYNNTTTKVSKKGLGFAITSLTLGIIAIFWTFCMLVSLEMGVETLIVELSYQEYELAFIVGYFIGYTIFSLVPGLLALIFGIISVKKQKRGMAITGIILGSLSILASIFTIIVLSNAIS